MSEMTGQMSLSRRQWAHALLVVAGNLVCLGLFVAILALSFMKFSAVSGTPHPETVGYHLTMYAPYFVATTLVAVVWRGFREWSSQYEIVSPFEAAREGGGDA
jgi:ABC-type uncharacterized transport system permease subunit